MLFAVLKVFGLAVGNLLGSLSALAKQERMLVINDITSGMRAPSSMMIMLMIMMIMMMIAMMTNDHHDSDDEDYDDDRGINYISSEMRRNIKPASRPQS